MKKPRFFQLHFRLRTDQMSSYRPIYVRLLVGHEKNYTAISTGVYVEADRYWISSRRPPLGARGRRDEAIEARLLAIRQQFYRIAGEQLKQQLAGGPAVTARTVIAEFKQQGPAQPPSLPVSASPGLIGQLSIPEAWKLKGASQ